MSSNLRLQVPITNKIKKSLEKKAEEEGFSSPNDMVRLLIHKFLSGEFSFEIVSRNNLQLSHETELRLAKSIAEINNGDYDLIDFNNNPKSLKSLYKDVR